MSVIALVGKNWVEKSLLFENLLLLFCGYLNFVFDSLLLLHHSSPATLAVTQKPEKNTGIINDLKNLLKIFGNNEVKQIKKLFQNICTFAHQHGFPLLFFFCCLVLFFFYVFGIRILSILLFTATYKILCYTKIWLDLF